MQIKELNEIQRKIAEEVIDLAGKRKTELTNVIEAISQNESQMCAALLLILRQYSEIGDILRLSNRVRENFEMSKIGNKLIGTLTLDGLKERDRVAFLNEFFSSTDKYDNEGVNPVYRAIEHDDDLLNNQKVIEARELFRKVEEDGFGVMHPTQAKV